MVKLAFHDVPEPTAHETVVWWRNAAEGLTAKAPQIQECGRDDAQCACHQQEVSYLSHNYSPRLDCVWLAVSSLCHLKFT